MEKLTRRQKGFVKDYIKTGNGTKAAARNYNVKSDKVAAVIASENLNKPSIQKAIGKVDEIARSIGLDEEYILMALKEDIDEKKGNRVAEMKLASDMLSMVKKETPSTAIQINIDRTREKYE